MIAIELALELSSGQVTVDMICERALISVRTFYNCFPSKDAALAGNGPPLPDEGALGAFRRDRGPDVLGDLLQMLATALEQAPDEREIKRARGRLLCQEPHLLAGVTARLTAVSQELVPHVIARLENTSPDRAERASAELIVNLATAVLTTAQREWARHGAGDEDPVHTLRRTISLARDLTSPRAGEGTPMSLRPDAE
ncbi:TetR/AcrR family transcriptional regulator [Propionicicella superfundia]|uniref:TetR/AcrR family transcriptional regulator n=1 Tax=Propionicicella superfundia TaxID=348582 RepID=UPI0004212FD1|nr:TetR/AcrR family transcriptional regulator [Propionicicella superfundia]